MIYRGEEIFIDDRDLPLLKAFKWAVFENGKSGHKYLVRGSQKSGRMKQIRFHREITECPDGMEVDHINGNGLDNRRENLRICTHHQNMMNRRLPRNNKSGIKGVSWNARSEKWCACIKLNKVTRHLGEFDDKHEAGKAYERASIALFGAFHRPQDQLHRGTR